MIYQVLMPVDVMFNNAVLSEVTEEADQVSYEKLYTAFLNMWQLRLQVLKARDLQMVVPNVRYFADSYAPKIAQL